MRLEIGGRIDCSDGTLAELADVVIDPTANRVTHLVVKAKGQPWVERLVPIELAHTVDAARRAVALRATAEELGSLPPVQEVAYPQLGDFPLDDPDWDVGIKDVYAPASYPAYDLEPGPVDIPVVYDRIPKGGVEIRRASDVYSAERHHLGHVDGLIVDRDEYITHLVLERGHFWGRREVTIPISAVAKVETDDVTLSLTKDQVGSLPEVAVQRGPTRGAVQIRGAGRGAGPTTEEAHDE
jgi:sporulation protein YlmC with PRC-barrel domain